MVRPGDCTKRCPSGAPARLNKLAVSEFLTSRAIFCGTRESMMLALFSIFGFEVLRYDEDYRVGLACCAQCIPSNELLALGFHGLISFDVFFLKKKDRRLPG